ncbi:pentatricopeptide repeat-containing protein At1g08070, chloroplastic-like [Bidens hawaiensis]|uniref:pentatricopeptide repeat-containing protein At1g08070, chloroplastic-like n=1 Tax=Bidens hawaiensis TaxID=980011 RepID=UPI0040491F3C
MARVLLSNQASTVASESVFSLSGRILSMRRTRITPESLKICICLKDHLSAVDRIQDMANFEYEIPLERPIKEVEEGQSSDEEDEGEDILMMEMNFMEYLKHAYKKLANCNPSIKSQIHYGELTDSVIMKDRQTGSLFGLLHAEHTIMIISSLSSSFLITIPPIHAQFIKTGLHNSTQQHPPDQFTWNTIIKAYSLTSSAIQFYNFMLLSNTQPNSYTFPSLFKSCARVDGLNEGKLVHGHVLNLGVSLDKFVHTSLIDFYVKVGEVEDARLVFDKSPLRDAVSFTALITGYMNQGRLEDARKLFDEMPVRDVVSWNSIISGHARNKLFKEAIDLFNEMQRAKIKPDESTLVTVLSACAQSGNLPTGEQIKTWIVDRKLISNVRLVNALIDMYSKCNELDKARNLFDITINKNIVTWNVMIGGYTHTNHYKESLDLFRTMLQSNYEANEVTLLSVLPACAHMGALDIGKWIHAYIGKKFTESSNMSLFTSLIDMYAKCGDIEAANAVFESMRHKSLASWNAMISGLSMHRRAHEAIELFKNMVNEGYTPDDITFIGVLSACSHAGLVNLGQQYFHSMIQDYKIAPKLQHYGCLIDLLARAGLFEEAMAVIKNMDVNPDSAIWGSLLGACVFYKNVHLGEYFASKVLELEPENSGAHMLLSNLYAANGKWDDVARIRTKFKDDGSKRIPGCTSIEIDGIVHEFLASDKTHPTSDKIYAMLEEVNRLLDEFGHASDKSLVLYDMEDELKEGVLCQHSERLAIAFGLISTKPGTTIRIMKNLRVCGNCHSATKLISKIFGREIIARDRNRFHHFKDGVCSCMDCW